MSERDIEALRAAEVQELAATLAFYEVRELERTGSGSEAFSLRPEEGWAH